DDNWLSCAGNKLAGLLSSSNAPVKEAAIEPVVTTVDIAPDLLSSYQKSRMVDQETTFQVDILVQKIRNLDTFDLKLMVNDPANLEIVKVTEGPFLKSLGGTTLFMSRKFDDGSMRITGSLSGNNPDLAPDGEGVIAHLTLKMLSPTGNIGINLSEVGYWDSDFKQLPVIQVPVDSLIKPVVFKDALLQNYPNPLNPETWIPFELSTNSNVVINIYSLSGELIRRLDLKEKEAGYYPAKGGADSAAYWDGKDEAGQEVASGVYLYQLRAGSFVSTRKMIVLK
ncbi:MAG: FlgD immunoglobulin-like domain containing protein, partial [bacterium]|nr:FlgD immunoglobulin-like domain containing protein [bacterium]